MKTEINIALASYGMSGRVFHAPLIDQNERLILYSVLERTPKDSKKRYKEVVLYNDYTKMLQDEAIDAVVINTPDALHFEMSKQAIEYGKHVIVEKPFTVDVRQAEQLKELSEEKNVKIFVFHNRRWDADFLTLKKLVANGKLGEIAMAELNYFRFRPHIKAEHWREKGDMGYEIMYNLGSHLIDQALALFGWPDQILADIEAQRQGGSADDYMMLILKYGKKRVILRAGYVMLGKVIKMQVFGTRGSWIKYGEDIQESQLADGMAPTDIHYGIENNELNGCFYEVTEKGSIGETLTSEQGWYPAFYEGVADELLTNLPSNVPHADDGVKVMRIIEKAIESYTSQTWISC